MCIFLDCSRRQKLIFGVELLTMCAVIAGLVGMVYLCVRAKRAGPDNCLRLNPWCKAQGLARASQDEPGREGELHNIINHCHIVDEERAQQGEDKCIY